MPCLWGTQLTRFASMRLVSPLFMQEAEDERARQQKEYESVLCERDILGGQLIKRNDELSALYEKVRLQVCLQPIIEAISQGWASKSGQHFSLDV